VKALSTIADMLHRLGLSHKKSYAGKIGWHVRCSSAVK
jgi:hypothetical protein